MRVGMGGLILILWMFGVILVISLIVAIFQIRAATLRTAEAVEDIYRLLKEREGL